MPNVTVRRVSNRGALLTKRLLARLRGTAKFLLCTPLYQEAFALNLGEYVTGESGSSGYMVRNLIDDPDTGMNVKLVRYPAGQMTRRHIHPCSHGIYVLQGTLQTDKGSYPADSFVWVPEGEVTEHGACPESQVLVLIMSNKPFQLIFI